MKWNNKYYNVGWFQEINNYNEKLIVAKKVASYAHDGDIIGFGSGSTAFVAIQEIAKRVNNEHLDIIAIPTSNEIRMVCISLGIPVASLNDVKPDWCFDGADEVDSNNWLIKGRGGAMFNEKLILSNASDAFIIVDNSKFVEKLGQNFPVPVECIPAGYVSVMSNLYDMGASSVQLRLAGKSKDGPIITENGNYILDTTFPDIKQSFESDIKSIVGVVESGLFIGYNVKVVKV